MQHKLTFLLSFFTVFCFAQLPEGFVYVRDVVPNVQVELRYCTKNNFVGEVVNGYHENVAILTVQAANKLKKVQAELEKQNLSLKIYDAYRPQQAVNQFMEWAQQVNDTLMKQQFYPNVNKRDLFKLEYIARRSRHSSGSTLDVTLMNSETGEELDMGTPYDFFGRESWVDYKKITKAQQQNRALLQSVMLCNGFRNYPQEWWHFTLKGEPFKNQYFDFVVE